MTVVNPTIRDDSAGIMPVGEHPGTFFELGEFELRRLQTAGYRRIGVAVVVLNSAGEVLVIDHKGNKKLADHTTGITSETVAYESPGSRCAEPNIRTVSRCLFEEVQLDPVTIHAMTRPDASFTLSDWPVGNTDNNRLLGINLALLLDDKAAEQAAGLTDTSEAYGASFVDVGYLLEASDVRPGTVECMRSLGTAGLLDVSELGESTLVLPPYDPAIAVEDIDLSCYSEGL